QIGMLAGMKSEWVAGFVSESMAGFFGIRIPVLLEDFHIREGSGGNGKWRAGNGTRCTIRALKELNFGIQSGHRRVPPFGLEGGEPGQVGHNEVRRKGGLVQALKGCDEAVLMPGDAFIISTPTGGGFGKA
ncbi:hydantoinase B/oxoprolinase family protein, partial [Mesorhizobium sp. M0323]|uniref:hydantoinase B/oxoprolinase family protein n=1 Tax=Mesorhizobium sp. M0323 TaxID=2956938 RepID=UPI00333E1344